jgi:hypothetical protein
MNHMQYFYLNKKIDLVFKGFLSGSSVYATSLQIREQVSPPP